MDYEFILFPPSSSLSRKDRNCPGCRMNSSLVSCMASPQMWGKVTRVFTSDVVLDSELRFFEIFMGLELFWGCSFTSSLMWCKAVPPKICLIFALAVHYCHLTCANGDVYAVVTIQMLAEGESTNILKHITKNFLNFRVHMFLLMGRLLTLILMVMLEKLNFQIIPVNHWTPTLCITWKYVW